jgi:hypothetical protein
MGAVLLTTWMAWGFGSHTISGIDPQNSTRELVAFHLSMAKLSKAAQASKTLEKLSETDPSLKGVAQLHKQKGPAIHRRGGGPHPRPSASPDGDRRCWAFDPRLCLDHVLLGAEYPSAVSEAGRRREALSARCVEKQHYFREKPLERNQPPVQ